MAGKIIVDTLDTDNSFITLNVQQATVATMNANGIFSRTGTKMIGTDGSIGNSSISGATVSGNLNFDATGTTGIRLPAANTLSFHTTGTEDMRISSAGNLLLGVTSESGLSAGGDFALKNGAAIRFRNAADSAFLNILNLNASEDLLIGGGGTPANITFAIAGIGEVGRFNSSGDLLVGKTSTSSSVAGIRLNPLGTAVISRNDELLFCNRLTTDGALVQFQQDGTSEGSISVSGTTVSYNGGHLSRYAQIANGNTNIILKGTVLSNLDEMNVYIDADDNPVTNEQLNKVKVSDTEGDADVAGVFVNWAYDEQHDIEEINMAMTGDMIIRIAEGVTVQKGDLLMSAGDGTAKPQDDDIVRSKTIAKVTSNHVTCTYEDGSYCVPCVLMAC
jgi:hypothetical protein